MFGSPISYSDKTVKLKGQFYPSVPIPPPPPSSWGRPSGITQLERTPVLPLVSYQKSTKSSGMEVFRKWLVRPSFVLATHTWVVSIRVIKWNPTMPFQSMAESGGVGFYLIFLTELCLEQESPNHEKRNLKNFRISLVKDLIGDFSARRKRGRQSAEPVVQRFMERHFPEMLPVNEKGRRMERRCKVCSAGGKSMRTSYICPDCDVGLCAAPCLHAYHQPWHCWLNL